MAIMQLSGYVPFGRPSNYYYDGKGAYRVILDNNCLDKADLSQCKCIVNHNDNLIIVDADELVLKVKYEGLYFKCEFKETLTRRPIRYDIANGIMKGVSIAYRYLPLHQTWTTINWERTLIINKVTTLEHVGPVYDPAYIESWVKVESKEVTA